MNDNQGKFASFPVFNTPEYNIDQDALSKTTPALRFPLYDGFQRSSEHDRLSRLGCQVVAYDKYGEGLNLTRSILDHLLPQLSHAIPSVHSAAAVVGAVYEGRLLSNCADRSELVVVSQYNLALRTLQQEIITQPYGTVPLLLACILLSCAEILQHRYSNAMAHLRGAFRVLSERLRWISDTPDPGISSRSHLTHSNEDAGSMLVGDGFAFLFRALDTHRSSYVLGRPPEMPSSFFDSGLDRPLPIERLGISSMRLVPLMHSCYHFIAKASECRDLSSASLLPEILVEQGRRVAELSSWLKTLEEHTLPTRTDTVHKSLSGVSRHTMMLRAQCLIMIIIIFTITSPFETTYDVFAPQFQQIVQHSAVALGDNRDYLNGLGQFYAVPGITQPLFFTALKYRHSAWRRQAIQLLRGAGREGPWDGQLLAAVASRAMNIEEATQASTNEIIPTSLTENDRLHGCLMDVESGDGQPLSTVRVKFSRCHGLKDSSSAETHWVDKGNWCTWTEDVKF